MGIFSTTLLSTTADRSLLLWTLRYHEPPSCPKLENTFQVRPSLSWVEQKSTSHVLQATLLITHPSIMFAFRHHHDFIDSPSNTIAANKGKSSKQVANTPPQLPVRNETCGGGRVCRCAKFPSWHDLQERGNHASGRRSPSWLMCDLVMTNYLL